MKYETFCERFAELSTQDKINLFNEYAREYDCDCELFEFDDDFFDTYFAGKPLDAVRACFFGKIQNWSDEWIKFNGYGNLVSLSDYEAEEWAEMFTEEIYEHEEIWSQYIDDDEEEEEEEEC